MNRRNSNSNNNNNSSNPPSNLLGFAAVAGLGILAGYVAYKFIDEIIDEVKEEVRESQSSHRQHQQQQSVPLKPPDQCSICFDELRAPMEQLPCEHLFHQRCILTWLETQKTCPVCRRGLTRKELAIYRRRRPDN